MLSDHTVCPACLIEYWSPQRLWDHMRKAPRCRRVFEASDPILLPTCKHVGKDCDLPPQEWWTTLNPPSADDSSRQIEGNAITRIAVAWSKFCETFQHDAELFHQAQNVHFLWREVLWTLSDCDDSVAHSDFHFLSAQHELARVFKACEGHSVYFRGFILTCIGDHCWLVPSHAKQHLERLVASTLHEEFISPQLL